MSILRLFTAIFLALGITSISTSAKAAAHCENVTIADMNWASASMFAHVDAIILGVGYGCDVSIVPGDTMPTSTSLIEKGEPSIAPELWSQNLKQVLDPAEAEGLIANTGLIFENGGEEGFWVPTALAEAEGLVTIEDALARPDLFPHPEKDGVGGFWGCPAGWNCQITTTQMFKAYDMGSKGFEYIDPGSGGALTASLDSSMNKGDNWFGYYWGPTSILGRYDLTKLDEGVEHNAETWISEINNLEVENPGKNRYPASVVESYVGQNMLDNFIVMDYLKKRSYPNKLTSVFLAWIDENQADGQMAAEYFITEHEDVWKNWTSADARLAIKKEFGMM
jgi:glycine betaine/proline transport system substrate-binding protein